MPTKTVTFLYETLLFCVHRIKQHTREQTTDYKPQTKQSLAKMKCALALLPVFLAATASARVFGSIYNFSNTTTSSSSAAPGIPTQPPVGHMVCAGGLDVPCQGLCTCSGGSVNCHADPTSRCAQMCDC
ncbi:hypothetical protein F4818DRAFT_403337 [Hypoxylon cercidicola]|nr:hypothetical protein F4818DRAFT_403337 [Hypoxylon cercidicola]